MQNQNHSADGTLAGDSSRPATPAAFTQTACRVRRWWVNIAHCKSAAVLGAALLLVIPGAPSATLTNRPPVRPSFRTNTVPVNRPGPGAANPAALPRPNLAKGPATNATIAKGAGTNALAKASGTNAVSSFSDKLRQFRASPAFPYAVGGVALVLLALLILRALTSRKRQPVAAETTALQPRAVRVPAKAAVIHGCNVLEVGEQARQVWQFDVRSNRCVLSREHTSLEGESLPAAVRKSWRSLFQRKLNVAWLPPEHVFLRVTQLPRSSFDETLSMVELQLEKLSPMPVAQIVWSIHVLPHAEGEMQTVVVMIVSRGIVEEFLGKLEAQGYLPDRLELPLLDQLQTTAITEDGAWIYPEAGGSKSTALVAWWYGGVLQNVDLVTLSPGDQSGSLKEQLTQMAWAGEMEGWLTSPPDWHLVADAMVAAQWEPVLRAGLEQPVEIVTPLPSRELAALTARRASTADPRASLMPVEYAERYRQQFVDRLWMRGLLGIAALYAIGVAVYLVALGFVSYQTGRLEAQVSQLAPAYTNAMQLKARYQVLKERQELKYAGLDCWNAVAQNLPESATLDSMAFSQGKRLNLNGTAPTDAYAQMNDFAANLQKVTVQGQTLFEPTRGLDNWRVAGSIAQWTLAVELKRGEAP